MNTKHTPTPRAFKLTNCPVCKGARRYSAYTRGLVHVSRNRVAVCRKMKANAAARKAAKGEA